MKKTVLLLSLLSLSIISMAQEHKTLFGFVAKPIFASRYFRTGPKEITDQNVAFTLRQQSGFSAGAVIRRGLTSALSVETGISYAKRIYELEINDGSFRGISHFKIIGYEIPLQAMVFIQLSRDIWMNVSLGPSVDIFPSDVQSDDSYFLHKSLRRSNLSVFNAGLIANIGWEWRTKNSGYIYAGTSYHRSLSDPYSSFFAYVRDPKSPVADAVGRTHLSGDYLTFDLRYYFNENVKRKVQRDQ